MEIKIGEIVPEVMNPDFKKVGGEWWSYMNGRRVWRLSAADVQWHVARGHAPFCEVQQKKLARCG